MKKKNIIIIGLVLTVVFAIVFCFGVYLSGISGMGSPTGGNSKPDYPYFITTREMTVKKIIIPKGTKLIYEEQFFRKGEQEKLLDENKLTDIELPEGETIDWGGIPVYGISKFFNPEMKGFNVYTDFRKINNHKTKFYELWQSCNTNSLGILVINTNDWSFNINNIEDISDCGGSYQRFFKGNKEQQKFLDELLNEMRKVDVK